MNVLILTILLSTLLALGFALAFLRNHENSANSSPERDSLLPLRDETPKTTQRHTFHQ